MLTIEFNGPKNIIDGDGNVHPLPEYVAWLQSQIHSLTSQLEEAHKTIVNLRLQVRKVPMKVSRFDDDFVDYPEDDRDR